MPHRERDLGGLVVHPLGVARVSAAGEGLVRLIGPVAPFLGLFLLQRLLYPAPWGIVLDGGLLGGRITLIALGIALVYRANRIVNFAQGDLGAVPASLGVLLVASWSWNYWMGLAAGLAGAVVLGVLVDTLIMRRFFASPRLLATVATIGVAQLLTAAALWLPHLFGAGELAPRLEPPFSTQFEAGGVIFDAHDILTMVFVPLALLGLRLFLRRSTVGTAILGAAERADRAAMLGIPVRRLHTIVWVVAAVLAFVAMYLRAGVVGLPVGQVLTPVFLVQALAAAIFGRFQRLTTIAAAAIGLGIVDQAITFQGHPEGYNNAVLFLVVLVGLLATRGSGGARGVRLETDASTWQAIREVRPLPRELARLPEVRFGRAGLALAAGMLVLSLPLWLSTSRLVLATGIVIFGIVAASLVVLTGWAGQVSLGHMAFMGVGAAVAGVLTDERGWDLTLAVLVAGAIGMVLAVVIGYPALRWRGLTLAVSTLAFAVFTSEYLLHRSITGDWLPARRIDQPTVLWSVAIDTETRLFYVAVVALLLAIAMVVGLRRSRTGRALVAIRENEQAATSYGINVRRTKVAAFAFSGFLAALAGALFVHQQGGLSSHNYTPQRSLELFSMVVIGGLGSLPGALAGTVYVQGVASELPGRWQFLATGVGLLAVLMLFPGGLGGVLADLRDRVLRRVAARRHIVVPSLVGSPRQAAGPVTDDAGLRGRSVTLDPKREGHSVLRHRRQPQPAPPHAGIPPTRPEGVGPRPTHSQTPLLSARGIDVDYNGVQVLFGVDVEIAEGEIVGLLGTNGAGKSTLLRALSGVVRPAAGAVIFDGQDITGVQPHKVAARGIAQVPGGQGVFTQLSVADNLKLAGWLQRGGADGKERARAAVDRVLDAFPILRERWGEPAGNLSGGERQMLTLGMAFLGRPRLLMIDELSLGLAPAVVDRLLDMVRMLRDQGTTIVLVEQSVNVALEVADRAYFMEKGEIRFEGLTAELLDRPDLLRSVFLDRSHRAQVPDLEEVPAGEDQSGDPVLEVREVARRFGGVRALDGVSFDVWPGEILGFVGPNGAGKTTLFDVISGFGRADGGAIRLRADGDLTDLNRVAAHRRAWLGVARSFQDGRLFPGLTVSETIAVARERHVEVRDPLAASLRLPGVVDSERLVTTRVDELVELLGLTAYRDKFVRELSTGTRRIVDLACVLAQTPRVVLLDEPSSGIAQREAEALGPVLQRVRRELGASLLVIEHDLPLLLGIADRMIALDLGRVIAEGEPQAVLDHADVVASYLGTGSAATDR